MTGEGIPSTRRGIKRLTILSSGSGRYLCIYLPEALSNANDAHRL